MHILFRYYNYKVIIKRKEQNMKEFFKNKWSIPGLIIGLAFLIFLLNIWILSVPLLSPYDENLWSLSKNIESGETIDIFAFLIKFVFYVSFFLIAYSGLSVLRKKANKAVIIGITYIVGFEILLIIFQVIFSCLTGFQVFLIILNILFAVAMGFLLVSKEKLFGETDNLNTNSLEKGKSFIKLPLAILIIDIISMIVLLSIFFIPLYSIKVLDENIPMIMINVIFSGETDIGVIISFFVIFVLTLSILFYFSNCVSSYFYDKESFIKKSKKIIMFVFFVTLLFFVTGLSLGIYNTLIGDKTNTKSYIPMLLMSVLVIAFSINIGKFHAENNLLNKEEGTKYFSVEPLIYVIILTIITGLTLFLQIIKIKITSGTYSDDINLSGIDILKDYASLEVGYRFIAFILVVMLISSGLCLVIAISSYFSKYRDFDKIVKSTTAVNIFFIFILSISGYYFQIGHQIDRAVLSDIFNFYNVPIPVYISDFQYVIKTDTIYLLAVATIVLIVMFMRKAFERDQMNLSEAGLISSKKMSNDNLGSASKAQIDDQDFLNFDPCVAFTELDKNFGLFQADLENRKKYRTQKPTLNALVNFIIEYARNSRLHLSYTEEDIATFVAGLGASKLSILQGMSGTGKTSLPKIFAEAIFGNCDIVEVESSWKDKNELLGYYNEFSMKYTPKKFTLQLYKAALNQNIFTFILLDEINLSRIEYYFSDFISLMENEENERKLKFSNIKLSRREEGLDIDYLALENGHTLRVPSNVWFVGTANLDETTFAISDKVYDRAQTMNFVKRAPKVRNYSNPIAKEFYDYQTLNSLLSEAKAIGNFDVESNELINNVESLLAPYNISFGNRVLKQIEDFVNVYKACFSNENVEKEAIEKILLSKVVAKLEFKTIDDKEELEMEFEKLGLYQCLDFVKRLDSE